MIHWRRTQQAVVLLISDLVAIVTAFYFTYWLRFVVRIVPIRDLPGDEPSLTSYLPVLAAAVVLVPLLIASMRLYRLRRTNARVESMFRLMGAIALGMLLVAVLVLLFYRPVQLIQVGGTADAPIFRSVDRIPVSRWFLAIFLSSTIAAALTGRALIQARLDSRRRAGYNLNRVLIAGTGPLAKTVIDKMRLHEEFGFQIVGVLTPDSDEADQAHRGIPILGSLDDVARIVRGQNIDQLYVALPLAAHAQILELLRQVSHEMVEVKVVPDLLQYITLAAGVEDLDGVPIVNLSRVPMEGFPAVMKRAVDIAAAAGCLLLFAPLFPLIAAAVRLTSPGPILYRQKRMGLDGRPFSILKFRSMIVGAEAGTGPKWADEHDARCTPIGAILRKLSLDELPQFWNILRGDMSLVGPRPERPHFVEEFREHIPRYMLRHRVRAGLTGWAQVHGWRGNTSLDKRIEYDLYYIEHWSLALDVKILWMTITNGMVHEHAY